MEPTPVQRTFKVLLWLAVSFALAAVCAWLISAHLAPRSFASAFWPCLACIVAGSLVLVIYNIIEAAYIGCLFLVVAFVFIPVSRKLHQPPLRYLLAAAVLGGFTSSRILRTAL
jgi:hypothetical protein